MIMAKALTFRKDGIFTSVWFVSLLAVAALAPFFPHQAITGPVVNATLFIAVVLLGTQRAILIGIFP